MRNDVKVYLQTKQKKYFILPAEDVKSALQPNSTKKNKKKM